MNERKNVRGVFEQVGGIEGDLRLRKLRHVAGENRTLTVHKENGCLFRVDIAKCYFSPRLSTERLRIAKMTDSRERVLNMFAGVGPFSITIAKKAGARVTSCELNEYAYRLHLENNKCNKVENYMTTLNADASELPSILEPGFDRVLMPHPSQSHRFVSTAVAMARPGAVIHCYRHVLGRDFSEAKSNLLKEFDSMLSGCKITEVKRIREVGPRWLELVADVQVSG